jgi:hypothetical protein
MARRAVDGLFAGIGVALASVTASDASTSSSTAGIPLRDGAIRS